MTNQLPGDPFTVELQQHQPSFLHKISSQVLCNLLKTTKFYICNRVYKQPKQILGVFKTFDCDFHCTSLPINDRINFPQPIHSKNQVMLQVGRNSTLNQITHRFTAHSACNYGYRASFRCFHLTAISQCYNYACAQNDGQLVFFGQLFSNKAVASATIDQS